MRIKCMSELQLKSSFHKFELVKTNINSKKTERHRETERLKDRERQRDRETERQRDRATERQRHRDTETQRD